MRWLVVVATGLAGCSAILDWKDKEPSDAIVDSDTIDLDTVEADAPEDTDGEPCDEVGPRLVDIRLTNASVSTLSPSVAWSGSDYGVVWQQDTGGTDDIFFRLLDENGAMAADEETITEDAGFSASPSLAWGGSQYGVSWADTRDANIEIYFARISPSGEKLGSEARITFDPGQSVTPSLAWTGSEFGLSWDDDRLGTTQIFFARISPAGTKLSSDVPISTASPGPSHLPSMVWTGSEFGVGYEVAHDSSNTEIHFVRVSGDGTIGGSEVRITDAADYSSSPSLAWSGGGYGVSWYDSRDLDVFAIFFALISEEGEKLVSDARISDSYANAMWGSLSWTGSEFGVSWYDARDGGTEIYFARISPIGEKLGPDVRVTNADGTSDMPSLVWSGSEFGLAWADARAESIQGIYFNLIAYCP